MVGFGTLHEPTPAPKASSMFKELMADKQTHIASFKVWLREQPQAGAEPDSAAASQAARGAGAGQPA